MALVIAICGFFGGWLLVAGPIFQATLELEEQEFDPQSWGAASEGVPEPERVSAWWWLLPPVAYAKIRRRQATYREHVMKKLTTEQVEQATAFFDKARGWLIVAGGAFLIAVKETWEMVELLHWPVAIFWVLIVVATGLSLANSVVRVARKNESLGRDPERKRAARPGRARPVGR